MKNHKDTSGELTAAELADRLQDGSHPPAAGRFRRMGPRLALCASLVTGVVVQAHEALAYDVTLGAGMTNAQEAYDVGYGIGTSQGGDINVINDGAPQSVVDAFNNGVTDAIEGLPSNSDAYGSPGGPDCGTSGGGSGGGSGGSCGTCGGGDVGGCGSCGSCGGGGGGGGCGSCGGGGGGGGGCGSCGGGGGGGCGSCG